jgi:hypothetical protein
MADPNTPNPPPRQSAQGTSQGGMMVPTPPIPNQTTGKDATPDLLDATKAEREAGRAAMQQNQDRLSREQEAGRKAMRATPGTQSARPRPAQPPTQAGQSGQPNRLYNPPQNDPPQR